MNLIKAKHESEKSYITFLEIKNKFKLPNYFLLIFYIH